MRPRTHFARRVARAGLALFASLLLAGCQRYQFTFNEQVVYRPAALFTDFELADRALLTCIDQTIRDQHISAAKQLTRLNCSSAGISDLDGLQVFTGLTELNLNDNQVQTLDVLQHLQQLRVLLLTDNRVAEIGPLLLLDTLQHLDLHGNPELDCNSLQQLASKSDATIRAPRHCR